MDDEFIDFKIPDKQKKVKISTTKPKGKKKDTNDYKLSEKIPTIFFYNDKLCSAQFLMEEPINFHKLGTIEWKPYPSCSQTVIIGCTKQMYEENNKDKKFIVKKDNENVINLSLLKSQLQKCVRRELLDLSIKTCVSMISLEKDDEQYGLYELLRRMTIIMIEDVFLSQSFTVLVWYLCALSKGMYMNNKAIKNILTVCYGMISHRVRDNAWENIVLTENICLPKLLTKKGFDGMENILWCLQFRKSYGGMHGDLILLDKLTYLWYNRCAKNDFLCGYLKLKSRAFVGDEIMIPLKKNEIIIEAIDFHCSNIISQVKEISASYDSDFLQKLMWDYQSSYNSRCGLELTNEKNKDNKEYKEIWDDMEPLFRMCANKIKNSY